MSTVDLNEVQFSSPNNDNQSRKRNEPAVINEPLPSYVQINTYGMQNPNQYQPPPPMIYQHGQPIFVVPGVYNTMGSAPSTVTPVHVKDYTAWSVFNICCCVIFLGALALIMSNIASKRALRGDVQGAKRASQWSLVLNIFGTITGIILIPILILHNTGHISL